MKNINKISKINLFLIIIMAIGLSILVISCTDDDNNNGTPLPQPVPSPTPLPSIPLMNATVSLDSGSVCGNDYTYCWEGNFMPRLVGPFVKIQATGPSNVEIKLALMDFRGVRSIIGPGLGSLTTGFRPSRFESHTLRVWISNNIPATITITMTQQCPLSHDCNTPTSPNPGPVSPEPRDEPDDDVIIVDKNNPNVVPPPCGTEDAVCGSITDGLLTADGKSGISTILVKSGTYEESVSINVPVILKAEHALETIESGNRLKVTASDVSIEGFHIAFTVDVTGSVTIRNSEIREVFVKEGGSAIIEHSRLYRRVFSRGRITVKNTTITNYNPNIDEYENCVVVYGGQNVLENNTLYGSFVQYSSQEQETSRTELIGNTIHGPAHIMGGIATFTGNTIFGDNAGKGILVGSMSTTRFFDNLIVGNTYALRLTEASTAFISQNRFDTGTRGITVIECEEATTMTTDGTNRLLNPNCWITCDGFPVFPGSELF